MATKKLQSQIRTETIFWQETFENQYNWNSYDATLTDAEWHLTNDDYYAYQGYSWWMGDPDIGGYLDHVYVVLDTEPILVPENGILTFKLNYNCEPPGTDSSTPEYNGWDGCNVRISTDGENWNVINGLPAYNVSSLYSFGIEHGEGANIAGWAGSSDGWIDAEFDLSAFSGQNVQIRFAFASDPATNTSDNSSYFGMAIDNIELGDFQNIGSSVGMIPGNMVQGGGDHWNQVSPGYESDTAMQCSEDNSIASGWENYLESDQFFLDNNGIYTIDCNLKGSFDTDSYWGMEASYRVGSQWSPWYNITNLENDPEQINYVFGAPGDNWNLASDIYEQFPVDISVISGHYIKLRVYLKTDDNASGTGITFDDFTITETSYPADAPTNLEASLNADNTVNLTWVGSDVPEIVGYNIYLLNESQNVLIGTTTDSNYLDENPLLEDTNIYAVTAITSDDETDYSDSVEIFVPAETATWLFHDDGSAESGYQLGTLDKCAVSFTTNNSYITHLWFYIEELGAADLNIKLWNSDANGLPTDEIASFFVGTEQLDLGWNFIFIPENIRPYIADGTFLVGLLGFANSAKIGLDEDSDGFSYENIDGSWQMITGNLMIRALADIDQLSVPESDLEMVDYGLKNFPNPFNPTTTISFSIPSEERVTVKIYNSKGQLVKNLLESKLSAGNYSLVWNGKNDQGRSIGSGIYFYKLSNSGKTVAVKKMLMLK